MYDEMKGIAHLIHSFYIYHSFVLILKNNGDLFLLGCHRELFDDKNPLGLDQNKSAKQFIKIATKIRSFSINRNYLLIVNFKSQLFASGHTFAHDIFSPVDNQNNNIPGKLISKFKKVSDEVKFTYINSFLHSNIIAIKTNGFVFSHAPDFFYQGNYLAKLFTRVRVNTKNLKNWYRIFKKESIKIASGNLHLLILTRNNLLYGIGSNHFGQLSGNFLYLHIFTLLRDDILDIEACDYLSLILTTNHKLFVTGNNESSPNQSRNSSTFFHWQFIAKNVRKMKVISNFIYYLDNHGKLFVCNSKNGKVTPSILIAILIKDFVLPSKNNSLLNGEKCLMLTHYDNTQYFINASTLRKLLTTYHITDKQAKLVSPTLFHFVKENEVNKNAKSHSRLKDHQNKPEYETKRLKLNQ